MTILSDDVIGSTLQALGAKITDEALDNESLHARKDIIALIDNDIQVVSSLIRLLDTRQARLRRQRNRITSATRDVPTELFQDMIRQSLEHWPERSDPGRLETLRTVCSSWSENILADKRAWATIRFTDATTRAQAGVLLRRSGGAPLEIVVDHGNGILSEVMPHAKRIQHLDIQYPRRTMLEFLRRPMLELRTLVLGYVQSRLEEEFDVFNPFSGVAPNLHFIRSSFLPSIASPHPSILQQLKTLSLIVPYNYETEAPFPLPLLTRIAPSCTSLDELELVALQPSARSRLDADHPRLILPPLESLSLFVHSTIVEILIDYTRSSPARWYSMRVTESYAAGDLQAILKTAADLMRSPGALIARNTEVAFSLQAVDGSGPKVGNYSPRQRDKLPDERPPDSSSFLPNLASNHADRALL